MTYDLGMEPKQFQIDSEILRLLGKMSVLHVRIQNVCEFTCEDLQYLQMLFQFFNSDILDVSKRCGGLDTYDRHV